MQKYKYVIAAVIIVLLGVVAVLLFSKDSVTNTNESGDVVDFQNARIPKLEEGVNVHELENEIFEILGPENVAITTDRSSGSGILWQYDGERLVAVTTSHLTRDFEQGEIELWSGEKVTFEKANVQASSKLDFAVIVISCEEKLKLDKGGASAYAVDKTPEIGAAMWVIDSVYGAASGIGTCSVASSAIFLEDYGTEMLLLYGQGKTGMSGSPMYDEDGRLVAMVSGMNADGTTLAAVPVGKIMNFFETLEE